MKRFLVLAAAALIACWAATGAVAAGSTSQIWNFSTDANPASPEVVSNAYGAPTATMDMGEFGTGWESSFPEIFLSAQGYWDIGEGSITLNVPNDPAAGPGSWMDVELQFVFWDDISVAPTVAIPVGATNLASSRVTLEENEDYGGAWVRETWSWRVSPNPGSGTFVLAAHPMWGSIVDIVSLSTTVGGGVVPEPGSLLALMTGITGLAGFAMRRRKA